VFKIKSKHHATEQHLNKNKYFKVVVVAPEWINLVLNAKQHPYPTDL
jgi:hypothetical protein